MVFYCFQKKRTGALLFSGEKNWCTTVIRRIMKQLLYCSQENEIGALLFSGEGIWCSTVLRRSKLVQGDLLFSGERNW